MKNYLYKVITKYGMVRFYKYEDAERLYESEGLKLYAYTKDIRPITILLRWK